MATKNDKAVELHSQWKSWREDLRRYWTQIEKNQEMYEFYKSEDEESSSSVSLNNPFAIVESLVAKGNETNLIVEVKGKGKNEEGFSDFEEWTSAIVRDAIEDPDIETYAGTFKKTKEQYEREYYVKGNAFAEMQWLKKKDGDKVLANGPTVKVLPFTSVIFNPSLTAATSDKYYVEKYVTWDNLKANEEKKGKGLYKNLYKLKANLEKDEKFSDHEDKFISADAKISRKVPRIQLLECWEGDKLTVVANGAEIIREAKDPFKIGRHPILVSMNYVIAGRPYAYGEIDPIYKIARAQDTIVNQNIQIINKYLRDAILVDPNSSVDLDALMNVIEDGGVIYGEQKSVAPIPANVPPQQAFMSIDGLQQAQERAARFSPYSSGVPAQETDKTQGTMGGIQALQKANEPNYQIKLDDLEKSFYRPLARAYLKMIANLMGEKDIRFGLLKGQNPQWVAATKNILKGKATIIDMLVCGMISEDEFNEYSAGLQSMGADYNKHVFFDVDWVVEVRLDNQSQIDKMKETQNKMQFVEWGQKLGLRFSPEKTGAEVARGFDIELEDILMTPEEEQEEAQKQQQLQVQQVQQEQKQQEQQIQQEARIKQQEAEQKMQEKMMEIQGKKEIEQSKGGFNG